jgi:hypothetical protein
VKGGVSTYVDCLGRFGVIKNKTLVYLRLCVDVNHIKKQMSTMSSTQIEARSDMKIQLVQASIQSAQFEYGRTYDQYGQSEQLETAWKLVTDLELLKRRILKTTTHEDQNNVVRDARVAALDETFEECVTDALGSE